MLTPALPCPPFTTPHPNRDGFLLHDTKPFLTDFYSTCYRLSCTTLPFFLSTSFHGYVSLNPAYFNPFSPDFLRPPSPSAGCESVRFQASSRCRLYHQLPSLTPYISLSHCFPFPSIRAVSLSAFFHSNWLK
ncbi:hypothetical protein AMECASPLE_026421 [Ameca splendens]|uniref:Uncharacterized protein n=1 Tax=Ameca splendens TaxID=208324 RepID=A0ABV0Z4G5_9TELE